MAVLPEEIPTGLVTGQFYFVNEDNADANTDPELTVVSGKVTFTCEAKAPLRMPTKKAVVIPLVFDAEFDSQGRLVPAGRTEVGIELPASDSALFNPTGFTWRVRFDLVDTATGFTVNIDPFSISVPEGVTSDLVDLMPVSTEPGTIMVQGPRGEQGIQGIQGPQGDGVPAGGTALQILRRNSAATGSEWVTPTKSIVGLGNVDNTSDAAKPLSSPQQNWILSRGTDLISNGTGLLGNNTNFSSFTFNPDAPMGAAGAFDAVGSQTLFSDEDIPVDTARRYLIRLMVKQRNANITGSRFYAGLAPRDKQGLAVMPQNYAYTTDTTTTLTAPLNPGDTTVNVSSTANWFDGTAAETYRYAAFWNWVDPAGRVWPQHTYTRNTPIYTALTATTLTLKTAYTGPALPADTPLSNTRDGGSYMYIPASNQIAPLQWTEFSGTVGGLHDGNGGAGASTKFPPGTAYIRLLFLTTYANTGVPAGETSTQSFGAISFSDATQALKELDSKAPLNSPAFTGTPTGITKAHVGLPNVDNTSDLNKPVSTAQQTALNAKANDDGLLKGTLGRKFRLIAGTIRNTGTGWFVLDDTGHRPTGVTGVTATATSIDIAFAATAKVVSFICGPDEVYAARGLRMGASVALDAAKVFCYQDNEHRISDYVSWNGTAWSSLNGVFSNISFDGAGKVSLTHEDVGTVPLSGAVSARPPAGAAANTIASLGGMTATTTNVEIRTPAGAVITALANPTNLWVERAGKRKTTTAVDPATLTEASGNIWFIGVVED